MLEEADSEHNRQREQRHPQKFKTHHNRKFKENITLFGSLTGDFSAVQCKKHQSSEHFTTDVGDKARGIWTLQVTTCMPQYVPRLYSMFALRVTVILLAWVYTSQGKLYWTKGYWYSSHAMVHGFGKTSIHCHLKDLKWASFQTCETHHPSIIWPFMIKLYQKLKPWQERS